LPDVLALEHLIFPPQKSFLGKCESSSLTTFLGCLIASLRSQLRLVEGKSLSTPGPSQEGRVRRLPNPQKLGGSLALPACPPLNQEGRGE